MLAALLLALQAAPAAAPDDTAADLRCLAIVAMAASAAPPEKRGGLSASAMYFVGRIDARTRGFDYRGEMARLVRSGVSLAADRDRCAAVLRRRDAALAALAKGMPEDPK